MHLRSQSPLQEEEAKLLQFPKRPRENTLPKARNKEENDKDEHPIDNSKPCFAQNSH